MKHVGQSGSRALFSDDVNGVVVDLDENVVVETGALSTLIASAKWKPALTEQSPVATEAGRCNAITTKKTQCTRNGKHSHDGKMYCPQHFGMLTK